MGIAARILIQFILTKQGRSILSKILLGIFALVLLPIFLIGGAVTSFSGMVQNDTDVFAIATQQVREEMKIENNLDPLFVRWLFLYDGKGEIPKEAAIRLIVTLFFVKQMEGTEAEPNYTFISEDAFFLLLESPDTEIPKEAIEELKELVLLRDEMNAGNPKATSNRSVPTANGLNTPFFLILSPLVSPQQILNSSRFQVSVPHYQFFRNADVTTYAPAKNQPALLADVTAWGHFCPHALSCMTYQGHVSISNFLPERC